LPLKLTADPPRVAVPPAGEIFHPVVREVPTLTLMPEPLEYSTPAKRVDHDFGIHQTEALSDAAAVVKKPQPKKSALARLAIPLGIAALVLVTAGLMMLTRRPEAPVQPAPSTAQAAPSVQTPATPVPPLSDPAGMNPTGSDPFFNVDPASRTTPEPVAPLPEPEPAPAPPVVTPPAPPQAPVAAAAVASGKLALSSPTSVEIFRDGQYLGSTPTSLDLPPGNHTLEYRHQDLRTTITHSVRSNETTRSMITFDVPMKINARPWAQVFVDGATRRSLGQTPLSDVRVPIGSTLVFRHPNFPEKSYRVTGRDTAIQIVFP
jgi:hypothetical protein